MLERNNPAVSVDELMAKVHAEVSARHLPRLGGLPGKDTLPADAVASAASIAAAIDVAEEKSHVRTRWSGRLNRFPFTISPRLQRWCLKILAFLFKDQRHVNFAMVQSLRESLAMNVRLAEQVDQLRARMNALDDRMQGRDEQAGATSNGTKLP